jgi:hypothetical protein
VIWVALNVDLGSDFKALAIKKRKKERQNKIVYCNNIIKAPI